MRRVLLVDDNRALLEMLERMLRAEGFEVCAIDDPLQLEAELVRFAPNVVVSDLQMPGRDGLEVLVRVKELAPAAVRCLLTGASGDVSPARLAALTPVSVFSKDIDPSLLLLRIRSAVKGLD